MDHPLFVMVTRLLLGALLGGFIGLDRETHGRPAGLRTHILVALGSTLFTLVSISYAGAHSDPARISAQIVTGVGFLGAGTIMRQGNTIRGLTTAASLWTAAAIGMAVGSGGTLLYLAIVASVVVLATLTLVGRLEHTLAIGRRSRELTIVLTSGRRGLAPVLEMLSALSVMIDGVRSEDCGDGRLESRIRITMPPGFDILAIDQKMSEMDGVESLSWD